MLLMRTNVLGAVRLVDKVVISLRRGRFDSEIYPNLVPSPSLIINCDRVEPKGLDHQIHLNKCMYIDPFVNYTSQPTVLIKSQGLLCTLEQARHDLTDGTADSIATS